MNYTFASEEFDSQNAHHLALVKFMLNHIKIFFSHVFVEKGNLEKIKKLSYCIN